MTLYKTDFLVSFVLKLNHLVLLLDSFLQGYHLRDLGKGARVTCCSLKSFEISSLFTKNWKMTLALKTEFLNPRWKLTVQDKKFRRNIFTIISLACWALIDLQRHDLANTLDQNPRPRNLTSRQDKTSLKEFNDWNNLIQQCQEGDKDTSSSIRVMACLMGCKNWHWWDTYLCKCKELWSLMEGSRPTLTRGKHKND